MKISYCLLTQTVSMDLSVAEMCEMKDDFRAQVKAAFMEMVDELRAKLKLPNMKEEVSNG